MDTTFWRRRWQENRIGFHKDTVHPALRRYEKRFLEGGQRILVPLCGKSVDLAYLADRGYEVVGVEVVEMAVQLFFAEQGRPADVSPVAGVPGARIYRADNLTVYRGDIFDLDPSVLGQFDRVWDRAALVALDESRRARYAKRIAELAAPGARLLQNAFDYEQSVMEGPPWSVSSRELHELYRDQHITELERRDLTTDEPRWQERGLTYFYESTYLIHFDTDA